MLLGILELAVFLQLELFRVYSQPGRLPGFFILFA
jgi:hypothetical protein